VKEKLARPIVCGGKKLLKGERKVVLETSLRQETHNVKKPGIDIRKNRLVVNKKLWGATLGTLRWQDTEDGIQKRDHNT